jgi:proteasome lid subunit RPN8/RPN11
MLEIVSEVWDQIIDHAIDKYPSEGCGILAGLPEEGQGTVYYPCRNIYDEMHVKDPEAYPRTSKTAYLIDGKEQQEIFDRVAADGLTVKSIVHSHIDHDAYFSEEDRYVAAPWGEPFYPEISYLVISIWDGKFKEANEFRWNAGKADFVGYKIKGM